jgi:hypothetical protein
MNCKPPKEISTVKITLENQRKVLFCAGGKTKSLRN